EHEKTPIFTSRNRPGDGVTNTSLCVGVEMIAAPVGAAHTLDVDTDGHLTRVRVGIRVVVGFVVAASANVATVRYAVFIAVAFIVAARALVAAVRYAIAVPVNVV